MFSQLRRATQAHVQPTRSSITTAVKRRFGGHHDEHHVETMSTHSELPVGDWRNKPMHWDFSRPPTSPYEEFVLSHLTGPEDPALRLTKGQFIVYIRRLAREQFGYDLYMQRTGMALGLLGFVMYTNRYWDGAHNVNTTTFAQRQYSTVLEQGLILKNHRHHQHFRFRLDEFFADHDEETIKKLPADLQQLYYDEKDSYNEKYGSQPDIIPLCPSLSPDGVKSSKQALMKQYNVSEDDIHKVIAMCDKTQLFKECIGIDDPEINHFFETTFAPKEPEINSFSL